MKILILSLFALCCFTCGLSARQVHFVTKTQILLTNDGIFVDYNGNLAQAQSLEFVGDGYVVSFDTPKLAGDCCQCGSRVGPNGRCENPACNNSGRNGPPDR